MVSYIFVFTHGDKSVTMYKDDEGMYRVHVVYGCDGDSPREVLVGVLEDRRDAAWLFNCKVQKLTTEWERSV